MERRSLLRQVVLGTGAGLTATALGGFGQLASDGRGSLRRVLAGTLDSAFTQGTVLSRDSSSLLLTNQRHGMQQVRASAATTVWREIETTWQAIEPGDFLYVKGNALPNDAVEGVRIWANIGWYRGVIDEVASDHVRLFLGSGTRKVYLTPLTLLLQAGRPAAHYAGQLSIGQRVEALGMFVPGGDMRATRLWIN